MGAVRQLVRHLAAAGLCQLRAPLDVIKHTFLVFDLPSIPKHHDNVTNVRRRSFSRGMLPMM